MCDSSYRPTSLILFNLTYLWIIKTVGRQNACTVWAVCHKLELVRRHSNENGQLFWTLRHKCKKKRISLCRLSRLCVRVCVRVSEWVREGLISKNSWRLIVLETSVAEEAALSRCSRISGSQSSASRWLKLSVKYISHDKRRANSVRRRWVPLHSTHIHPCPMRGGDEAVDVLLTAIIELSEPAERTSQDWSGRIHPSNWFITLLLWLVTLPVCNRICWLKKISSTTTNSPYSSYALGSRTVGFIAP